MRIGFFTTHFPYKGRFGNYNYFCGGEGEVAYELAVNLMERGHNITVFTTSSDSHDALEKHKKITVHRYGRTFKIFDTYFSCKLLHDPSKYDVDIIHAHFSTFPGPLAALIYFYKRMSCKNRIPFVVTYHLDPIASYGNLLRRVSVTLYNRFFVNTILQQADCIIAFSEGFISQSKILQKYRNRIKIIPNGINFNELTLNLSKSDCRAELGLSDGEFIILFVGSLTERKGPDILLKSISIVRERIPNVKLIFVGPSLGRLQNLKVLARKLHMHSVVDFKGFVDEYKKRLYLGAADLFVLPSFAEGFPIALLEASVFGLPMIVSDLEALRPIIEDGQNGLLAKTGDYQDFARKISYLLKNEGLRERMSRVAKEKVRIYSWDKIASETEKIYVELSERRDHCGP